MSWCPSVPAQKSLTGLLSHPGRDRLPVHESGVLEPIPHRPNAARANTSARVGNPSNWLAATRPVRHKGYAMGLFDLFKSKPKAEGPVGGAVDKNLTRLARVAGDKHAQNFDRMEAIDALAKLGSAEAAAGLLKRFTFHIDPSITDQEEKEVAHRGVLAAADSAIEPIRVFCARAESLTWPLKILKELVDPPRYEQELLKLLSAYDTEYTRNVEPKQQLISELEECKSPEVRVAVERFLEDVNEVIRFCASATVLAQDDPASVGLLLQTLASDESVRVRNRIAEGLATRGWVIPAEMRDLAKNGLPNGFGVDAEGRVKRR